MMRIPTTLLLLPVLVQSQSLTTPSTQTTLATSIVSSSTVPSPSSGQLVWMPVQTILNPSSTNQPPSSTSIPEVHSKSHDLELREIVAQPPQVLPGDITQVDPVTTLFEQHWVNGVPTPVQIVYSQAFSAVPDQLPGPMSGSIGLGNIKGKVGVVKTVVARGETPLPEVKKLRPRSGTDAQAKASGVMFALVVVAAVGIML